MKVAHPAPQKIRKIGPGRSFPLGATVQAGGTNFCVFSRNGYSVELLLFDSPGSAPSEVISLDPTRNRTFYYWHIFVQGVGHGQLYGWRVHGPFEPADGLYFRGDKLLVDPYTKAVAMPPTYRPDGAMRPGDNAPDAMKSVVVDLSLYDWRHDTAPRPRPGKTIIYELHVGGFTKHPSSGLPHHLRGTYRGLIEKIPYLRELGITAVELMPVQQFDPFSAPDGRTNYWGYSPVAFFAPHSGYASHTAQGQMSDPAAVVDEFRDMVWALHAAGIQVVLDVVFNHTAEGNEHGPTLSLRGFENRAYYIPQAGNRAQYANFSGCGNTINGNHSIVRRLILDSLRYWVRDMHVDAFRFDLASVLARDELGNPLTSPPVLWEIESDPVLAGTRIIAEAWDAAGLYQVGSFIGHRWAEWNGHFRDDVRRFIRGDEGTVWPLTRRLVGSPDIYPDVERDIERTVNFVTAHDGFTLMDLVSYSRKHNEANGEDNRDGGDANFSHHWGVEGPTDNPQIQALRWRQMRNFLTLLCLAQGTPMILMGDEVGRSQQGNNNAYCHDSELTWFNWQAVTQHSGSAELLAFMRRLLLLRASHPAWDMDASWDHARPDVQLMWSGVKLAEPDFAAWSHSLALTLEQRGPRLHAVFNAFHQPLRFALPPSQSAWHHLIDTARPAPLDFIEGELPAITDTSLMVASHSCVVLIDAVNRFPFA